MIDILPLEVWDAPVDGRPLQDWRHDRSLPTRLAALVRSLIAGTLDLPSERARERLRQLGSVVLAGGGAGPLHVRALRATGLPTHLVDDPVFAAVRAGWAHGPQPVDLCADVGQTSIKLYDGRRAWRVDRDLQHAPLRTPMDPERWDHARMQTLRFVASTLRRTAPARVRLALPCTIVGGQLGECTYCWNDPDRTWAAELCAALELEPVGLHLHNDAELAAWAVAHGPPPPPGPTLVLTIGFGVGAALLGPRR